MNRASPRSTPGAPGASRSLPSRRRAGGETGNEKYRYWWNYHWGTVADHRSAGSEEWVSYDLARGFHDYAGEWSPDSMRFYFDGELRGSVSNREAVAGSRNMYIILNFAVGGWPGSPPYWPAGGDTYEIDWIRVRQIEEPREFIDLGKVVAGGNGSPGGSAPYVGIHPATGEFSRDLDLDSVEPSGANPAPVSSSLVDGVFLMTEDSMVVNSAGTRYRFPTGDSSGSGWDLIANAVEADGPPGMLRLGPKGVFTRGIGVHAASGITFDLDALRASHGQERVAFFSAFAGEGSFQGGGTVNNHVLLADEDGRILHAESTGTHRDNGRVVELEFPRNARFLTLATGTSGDGSGQDHGVFFCNAFITPCSVSDPGLCPPPADEILVFSGSAWRYLDRGPAPGADWTARSFATTGWKTGRAPLGYGNGDEATPIGFGGNEQEKRVTTHSRHTFAARSAGDVTHLSLRLLRDDGAVVYLNGTEILRDNLPVGAVDADTLAGRAISGGEEAIWLVVDVAPCLLVDGANVIAVEIHQASRTSSGSDLGLDLVLAAERTGSRTGCDVVFLRGDCNADGLASDITDPIFLLEYSFLGTREPPCLAACDADSDGDLSGVTDPIYLLAWSSLGGPSPVAPFPGCGPPTRPTDDVIGCETVAASCSGAP